MRNRMTRMELRGWLRGTCHEIARHVSASGLSQAEVARRAGVSRAQLCDIVNLKKTNISLETLVRITGVFNKSPGHFVICGVSRDE
jgi:transcriptional regulator with XRE-family HTH domain